MYRACLRTWTRLRAGSCSSQTLRHLTWAWTKTSQFSNMQHQGSMNTCGSTSSGSFTFTLPPYMAYTWLLLRLNGRLMFSVSIFHLIFTPRNEKSLKMIVIKESTVYKNEPQIRWQLAYGTCLVKYPLLCLRRNSPIAELR